jgi:hypothetical protein
LFSTEFSETDKLEKMKNSHYFIVFSLLLHEFVSIILHDHSDLSYFLPRGNLSGTRCTSEGVRNANDFQLNSILSELINTTYFRLVKVNMAQSSKDVCDSLFSKRQTDDAVPNNDDAKASETCSGDTALLNPWMSSSTTSNMNSEVHSDNALSCSVIPAVNTNDNDVEFLMSKKEQTIKEDYFNDSCFSNDLFVTQYGSSKISDMQSKSPIGQQKDKLNFWHDLCTEDENKNSKKSTTTLNDKSSHSSVEYVNIILNQERNTGYNGSTIWNEIYAQNCLSSVDLLSKNVNDFFFTKEKNKSHQNADICLEERVLHRLLSGWHASVSIHISAEYFFSKNKWQPNLEKFMDSVGNHLDRLENLHFAYVVALRALFKAKDVLYLSSWSFNTGNKEDDEVTQNLMRRLLDSSAMSLCSPLAFGFDETVLFNSFQHDAANAN